MEGSIDPSYNEVLPHDSMMTKYNNNISMEE